MMKKLFVLFGIFAVSALISGVASAKTIDRYNVAVQVENSNFSRRGSQAAEIALAAAGITCTSQLSVEESEEMLNKKGKEKDATFSRKSDFSLTLFGQPQATTPVTVNPDHKNARVNVQVTENCSGYVRNPYCVPSKDNNYNCKEWTNIPMVWRCDVPAEELPSQHQFKEMACTPPNNLSVFNMIANPIYGSVANLLHEKTFKIQVQSKGREMHFENYNCPKDIDLFNIDPSVAKIIRLAGGVKTRALVGNDIRFDYSINDGPSKMKDREEGISNFDILYCFDKSNPSQEIDLKISASHNNHSSSQEVRFTGGVTDESHKLQFSMPGTFGSVKSEMDASIAN